MPISTWKAFCKPQGTAFLARNKNRPNRRGSGSRALHVLVLFAYHSIGLRDYSWQRNHPSPSPVRENVPSASLFYPYFIPVLRLLSAQAQNASRASCVAERVPQVGWGHVSESTWEDSDTKAIQCELSCRGFCAGIPLSSPALPRGPRVSTANIVQRVRSMGEKTEQNTSYCIQERRHNRPTGRTSERSSG